MKMDMLSAARLFAVLGVLFLVVGAIFYLLSRSGVDLGRLPGNIRVESGNLSCVIALGASILLSVVLTLVLNLAARWLNK